MSKKSSQALLGALSLALCILAVPSAQAQTRAALVQNMDEPGRNPYQEAINANCRGTSDCSFNFSEVPAGKRLVVTHVNGYTDVAQGTRPNGHIDYAINAPVMISASSASPTGGLGTRMYINQPVLFYVGPGGRPRAFMSVVSDTFSGGTLLQLSGYYITLP